MKFVVRKILRFCRRKIPDLRAEDISPYHITIRKCIGNDFQQRKRTRHTCENSGGRWLAKEMSQNIPLLIAVANTDEELLEECPVCFESFSSIKPRFMSRNCTHSLCVSCYLVMIKNACRDFHIDIACPLCREPFNNTHLTLLLGTDEERINLLSTQRNQFFEIF